jgi:hypothetical protein
MRWGDRATGETGEKKYGIEQKIAKIGRFG